MDSSISDLVDKSITFVYSFKPLITPTLILVPSYLTNWCARTATLLDQDLPTFNYTIALFLAYPLGLIMLALPYGPLRHFFSFVMGAFLLQFTINVQWVHHLISSLIAYLLLCILPHRRSKTFVPCFAVLYCVAGHLHRQFVNYLGWDLDFTGPQMVLTIKLSSLAYNLYDGQLLKSPNPPRAATKCSKYALPHIPSLLSFLGYTFCFSNILAGPAFEFSIYNDAINGTKIRNKKNVPSSFLPTLIPLTISLFCMVLFVVGNGAFPIMDPIDPQNNDPVWIKAHLPWIQRYGYQWIALFFIRQKYYFAWKNAEGANNIWYAGWEGQDASGKSIGWDNACNIDIVDFETAPNLKTLSAGWNKKTSNWLTRYVYMRTGGSLLATYAMSAFWHGFYPGYYLFFLSMPCLTACERLGRKKLSPYFSTGGKWSPWGIVTMLTTSFLIEYFVQPFQVLAFSWGWEAWSAHHFFGHVLAAIFYIVVSMVPTKKEEGKKQ